MQRLKAWLPWVAGILGVSVGLAGLDWRGAAMAGWAGYIALAALCAGILWAAWRWGSPSGSTRGAAWAMGVAVVLRLGLAIFLAYSLPSNGYDNPHQRAGYFFPDAYDRDNAARVLAQSDEPLLTAFTGASRTDQYGGLLFLSALTYRVLSPEVHRPLLVLVLSATAGGLATLFTWRFGEHLGGKRAGALAGWMSALYPEMVLLGASQMREPFIGAGLALALYGYVRGRGGSLRPAVLGVGSGVLLATVISPPYGALIAGIVLVAWMWEGRGRRSAWGLAILAIVALAALGLTVRAWSGIELSEGGNVIDLVGWWLSASARFEIYKLEQASGMVQVLFDQTPEWAHMPMATGYGLIRPFFPAALTEEMAPLARGVEIARSLGWLVILPFLLYAPLAALRRTGLRGLPTYLALVVWATAILASYRAGGDGWDNVRYRSVFLAAQAGLAGWAWAHARQVGGTWLRRTIVIVAGVVLIFLQWYLGRYVGTPSLGLNGTLALLAVFSVLAILLPLARDWRRRRRLTARTPAV